MGKRMLLFLALVAPITLAQAPQKSAISQSDAQEASRALVGLKTCERELQVLQDGSVVESREGKKTERRLSASRMRKLRHVIARAPCPMPYQTGVTLPRSSTPCLPMLDWHLVHISAMDPDALQRVEVNLPDGWIHSYIACAQPTADQREWLKRNGQEYVRPKWERFLLKLVAAVGGENILAGCKCRQ